MSLVKSDLNCITGSDSADMETTAVPESMYAGPEKSSYLEGETVGGTDGSNDARILSCVTVLRPNGQDVILIGPLSGSESGTSGAVGPGKGKKKKKIVRKTVRVVKKVIKRRVPKKPLLDDSESRGESVKKEDNDLILMEVAENSNIVDDAMEDSNIVGEVTDKCDLVDEVEERPNITDEVTETSNQGIDARELEPMLGKKGNDTSGIVSMEMDNLRSNGVMTGVDRREDMSVSDSMEDDKVRSAGEGTDASEATKGIDDLETGRALNDNLIVDTVINEDVGLVLDQKVDLVGEALVDFTGEKSGFNKDDGEQKVNEEVSSKRGLVNEVLLLSGELEALERKKRRKTEVYVGGLSQDTTEDDVQKVFEKVGVVLEARLVIDAKRGKHRGFAFVRFAEADDAKKALSKYSKVEICGKQCTTAAVEGNDTLYLGNIDRKWKTEDIVKLLTKAGIEKIDEVTLKTDPNNIENNRGFAFVELETSKDAQIAFHKLQKKGVFGTNTKIKVDWAQPLIEPSEEEILQVKSVYAEFLPSSWDKEKVKKYFKRFGEIENITLAKDLISSKRTDFAFINYTTREAALTCIDTISREGVKDNGSKVNISASLAKPIPKSKQNKLASNLTSKQLYKEKPKTSKASIKLHEPRNKGKVDSISSSSSTTDELVQILRRQASTNQIPPRVTIGSSVPDHHFPLPGSKRPFSHVGRDRLYLESRELPRARVETSYPLPGFSAMSRGDGTTSFPYHHHQESGFTSESVRGRNIYPGHFRTSEQAPYYGNNNIYRRY